jgi:secreted pullulanase
MRWDMMGDATADAVQKAFNEAKKINPNVIFIGEGWRTFKGDKEDPSLVGKGADQGWMCKTRDVGSFSDEMRNELKSGFMSEGEPAFISGGAKEIKKIFRNIKGDPTNFETLRPANVVQYIEAHDNLTVFDVIAKATKLDPEIPANYAELHKRIRLGLGLVLTSQGVAFIHAGQEYGRTKQWLADSVPEQKYFKFVDASGKDFRHPYFIHDSYDSSDAVNKFDWTKATNAEVSPISCESVEYTKGLIALRKSSDAFRLGSKKFMEEHVKQLAIPEIKDQDLAIAYSCSSISGNETFYVFVNCDSSKRAFTLSKDLTKGDLIVDGKKAGVNKIDKPFGVEVKKDSVVLEPLTLAIIRIESNK